MRWSRREILTTTSILAAGVLGRPSAFSEQTQTPGARRATPPATGFRSLCGDLGIFIGQGGTIGWLGSPDGVVVVDAQMPPTAKVGC